jgi:hypothetical protein
MKFTKTFMTNLKNFSEISSHMYFAEGNVQTICVGGSKGLSFFARMKSDVEIDSPFAIVDLHKLLATINLCNNPEIIIQNERKLIISDDKLTIEYSLTRPSYIHYESNPSKFKVPTEGIMFNLKEETIVSLKKMSNTFKTKNISFVGDGEKLFVLASNEDDPTSDKGKILIGETEKIFSAVLQEEDIKILSSDYDVTIIPKGLIYMTNGTMEYYIPVNKELSKL